MLLRMKQAAGKSLEVMVQWHVAGKALVPERPVGKAEEVEAPEQAPGVCT